MFDFIKNKEDRQFITFMVIGLSLVYGLEIALNAYAWVHQAVYVYLTKDGGP